MLKIMNNLTGEFLGEIEMAHNGPKIDELRRIVIREFGFNYSLIWEA